MKYFPLVWKNVWRRKFRTTFTLLSIFIAFVLFGVLMTIRTAFSYGVDVAGLDRLVLINKVTLIMPLPFSYQAEIERVPGVEAVAHQSWFNGMYRDQTTPLTTIAIDPATWPRVYTEIIVPPEQWKAFAGDRQGAIVGRDLAEQMEWKVGDRVPLRSTLYQPKPGSGWEFNIDGIFDAPDGVDKTQFFFQYDYLVENSSSPPQKGLVGWYVVRIADPSQAVTLSRKFDEMFANSRFETRTTTEKGFVEGFATQVGDIGTIMVAISSVVLFMFGLVAASTMSQSGRRPIVTGSLPTSTRRPSSITNEPTTPPPAPATISPASRKVPTATSASSSRATLTVPRNVYPSSRACSRAASASCRGRASP